MRAASAVIAPVDSTPVVRAITITGRLRLTLLVEEVAELLFGATDRGTQQRVRRLIENEQLRATSTGRVYLISAESLLAFIGESAA